MTLNHVPDATAREAELAREYDAARPHLVRVAYAVLGSRADAEDVVADCWLRLPAADAREPVRDVTGWATVTVARAALDLLRSARHRREVYTGPWLPEPLLEPLTGPAGEPEDRVTLDESISYALMVVLESLTPAERVAWVLHDLFGLRFEDIAAAVGRTPASVRQLAKRARARVQTQAPRVDVDAAEHAEVLDRFLTASLGGSLSELVRVLDPGVVLVSDGGGVVRAARRPVVGADRVARFLLGVVARAESGDAVELRRMNGVPGIAITDARGRVTGLISFTVAEGRVSRIDMLRAPEKVAGATGTGRSPA
jgi:RNA polymerase sigma-70 factor (ECF subfamily)